MRKYFLGIPYLLLPALAQSGGKAKSPLQALSVQQYVYSRHNKAYEAVSPGRGQA